MNNHNSTSIMDNFDDQNYCNKLGVAASLLGATLKVAVDIITETQPGEEKKVLDVVTGKQLDIEKPQTETGEQFVTITEGDDKKTYRADSAELKERTDNVTPIIAFTDDDRKVLAELGYHI